MFAEKSMDVNSSLLKLKLEMVYRNLSTEEAQKVYSELTATVPPKIDQPKTVIKRKVVKALVPKST
jgi:BarA-like signal transduction histidine kinase